MEKVVGQIISGGFGKILLRQKSGRSLEIGELLVAETSQGPALLQIYDLIYGSQLSQQNIELISGIKLEEDTDLELLDAEIRNYNLALVKSLILLDKKARICKSMPHFFSHVRELRKEDLAFLTRPNHPLFIGKLRSGSKTIDFDLFLEGDKVFAHHLLIAAQTGKGKSNLSACMLWNVVDQPYCGILVLDPHDEYYGRNKLGLKDHSNKEAIVYYTSRNPPPGAKSLKLNIKNIRPSHFNGVVNWSDPQREALYAYYKRFDDNWISALLTDKPVEGFQEGTLSVVKRRLLSMLDLELKDNQVFANSIFDLQAGSTTITDIVSELEQGKLVIVDTSHFSGNVELLIGSLIATEVLNRYRRYKAKGELDDKPVISIFLEEAPRVLGREVLERGPNIFSTISREGRKFKVGLTAITQLPSLIPRDILSNMGTKIILGLEMANERRAVIDSAAQDLSDDDRNIASLDVGEAIVSSSFSRFATPIKIPLFESFVKQEKPAKPLPKQDFTGVKLTDYVA